MPTQHSFFKAITILAALTYIQIATSCPTVTTEAITNVAKINIISGGNIREFVPHILKNHQTYASHRNYDYRYFNHSVFADYLGHLRPHWLKVLALENQLNQNLQDGSWLIWLDDDVLINDFKQTESIFSRYIHTYSTPENCLLVTADCDEHTLLNTGVLMFRVSECARDIVEQWWSLRPKKSNCHHDEQAKLIDFFYHNTKPSIRVVPQRDNDFNMNTFMAKDTSRDCFARKDDYVTQPAGASESEKNSVIPKKAELIFNHYLLSSYKHDYQTDTQNLNFSLAFMQSDYIDSDYIDNATVGSIIISLFLAGTTTFYIIVFY